MSELRYRFNIDGIDKTSSLLGGLSQTIDNVVGKLGKANTEMVAVAGQARRLVITGAGPSSSDAQPRIDPSTIEPATKGMYETAKTFAGPATAEKLKKDLQGIQEDILESMFPASVLKNLTFGINPLLNPTSVWGNLFALRQNFSALASKDGRLLQEKILEFVGLGRLSGTTGGAAAATGVLMSGLLAVGLSLKALTEIIRRTSQAFQDAHKLYSQALQSGMSLRIAAQMNTVGGVLGVDPAHAMAFSGSGNAAKQVQRSVDVFASAAPELADTVMQFRILGVALKEFFTIIAKESAGSLRALIVSVTNLVRILTDAGLSRALGLIISAFTWVASSIIKLADLLLGVGSLILNFLTDLINNIPEIISKMLRGNTAGNKMDFQFSEKALDNLKSLFNPPATIADEKLGMARQIPASAWEKMGLVVGGIGGGTDYAKRTTKATERTADYLYSIVSLPRGTTTGINPAYPAP